MVPAESSPPRSTTAMTCAPKSPQAMSLADLDRLREEDPFTGACGVRRALAHHRPPLALRIRPQPRPMTKRSIARPSNAGASKCGRRRTRCRRWSTRSLALHARILPDARRTCSTACAERHGRFVVIDVHSYNHRRDGPDGEATPQDDAPDINIGTFSMPRDQWAFLLDPLIEAMRDFDFNGRQLDVRENVAFQGKGEQTRFVHAPLSRPGLRHRARIQEVLHGRMVGRAGPARSSRRCAHSSSKSPSRPRSCWRNEPAPASCRARPVPARIRSAGRTSPGGRRKRAACISTAGCRSSSSTARRSPAKHRPARGDQQPGLSDLGARGRRCRAGRRSKRSPARCGTASAASCCHLRRGRAVGARR